MDSTLEKMMAVAQLEVMKIQFNRKSLDSRIQAKKLKIREYELETIKLWKEVSKMMTVTDEELDEAYKIAEEKIKELKEELNWK